MTATRKAHVPMTEQIRLISGCRQSGMTDADWCRKNDIAVKYLLQLDQTLQESGSGSDSITALRSS